MVKLLNTKLVNLSLEDTIYRAPNRPFHDRQIVRGIVYVPEEDKFAFAHISRNDIFVNNIERDFIETSGGGVEEGESEEEALKREIEEELGYEVEVICKIGVVSDYYNLIARHNINNYYLAVKVGTSCSHQTSYEKTLHLSRDLVTLTEALEEYEKRNEGFGVLLAQREIPIVKRVIELVEEGVLSNFLIHS